MKIRKYVCPSCKSKEGVDILYGMPTLESHEAAERGEIALGGCVLEDDQPERKCMHCGHEWRIKRKMT